MGFVENRGQKTSRQEPSVDLNPYYEYIEKNGKLRSPEHARRWSRGVLNMFGTVLDGRTKRALAKALPDELAAPLKSVFWLIHFRNSNMTSYEFQNRVARRSGNSDARFARFPTMAVFGAVKQIINKELTDRVAQTLAPELRDLWQNA